MYVSCRVLPDNAFCVPPPFPASESNRNHSAGFWEHPRDFPCCCCTTLRLFLSVPFLAKLSDCMYALQNECLGISNVLEQGAVGSVVSPVLICQQLRETLHLTCPVYKSPVRSVTLLQIKEKIPSHQLEPRFNLWDFTATLSVIWAFQRWSLMGPWNPRELTKYNKFNSLLLILCILDLQNLFRNGHPWVVHQQHKHFVLCCAMRWILHMQSEPKLFRRKQFGCMRNVMQVLQC